MKKKDNVNRNIVITLILLAVAGFFMSITVAADELKFKFKNPSFSGIGTGAH